MSSASVSNFKSAHIPLLLLVVAIILAVVVGLQSQQKISSRPKASSCGTTECSYQGACQLKGYRANGYTCVGGNRWQSPDGSIVASPDGGSRTDKAGLMGGEIPPVTSGEKSGCMVTASFAPGDEESKQIAYDRAKSMQTRLTSSDPMTCATVIAELRANNYTDYIKFTSFSFENSESITYRLGSTLSLNPRIEEVRASLAVGQASDPIAFMAEKGVESGWTVLAISRLTPQQ